MIRTVAILILFFSVLAYNSSAQNEEGYEYNSEFNWGVNKNSAGGLIGGFFFKKGRKLGNDVLETYGLEIVNVKHPLESRQSSNSGNFFIFGKSNYLFALRFQYGRDWILFKKASHQGVEIKAVTAVGPTIGLRTPYFIERALDGPFNTINEPYDPANPNHSFPRIIGPGKLFEGLGQSAIQPGANIKAALNFETGVLKSSLTGFEVGFLLDAYLKKVEIMPTAANKGIFPTVFLSIFYGSRK